MPLELPTEKSRSVDTAPPVYWRVPPFKTKLVAVFDEAPMLLLLPPLARLLTESVPPLIVVAPVYVFAPERTSVPAPALVNPVAVVLLMTPAINVSVAAVPSLIVKVRVTPVVALLLRLIFPLIVAVPLLVASKVMPTPLVVVLENTRFTALDTVVSRICNVVAVLPARVKVCVPPVLARVPLLKMRLPIVSA